MKGKERAEKARVKMRLGSGGCDERYSARAALASVVEEDQRATSRKQAALELKRRGRKVCVIQNCNSAL